MTTDFDPRTRIVLSWLREEAHENPEHMLLRALDEANATPQRRSWPAWRSNRMNTYAKLIVAAAAVLVVAFAGFQLLPRRWVVERTLAWLSKCRGLLVRYEKKAINFLGRLQLACALIWMRRRARLIGD